MADEVKDAETIVRLVRRGRSEESASRLREISDCIHHGGDSFGIADWDDVRDYVFWAAKTRAAIQASPLADAHSRSCYEWLRRREGRQFPDAIADTHAKRGDSTEIEAPSPMSGGGAQSAIAHE